MENSYYLFEDFTGKKQIVDNEWVESKDLYHLFNLGSLTLLPISDNALIEILYFKNKKAEPKLEES